MQEYLDAANALIETLEVPPQVHAIWVHAAVDPETHESVHTVRAAIHPQWKGQILLPREVNGLAVVQVDWETLLPLEGGAP